METAPGAWYRRAVTRFVISMALVLAACTRVQPPQLAPLPAPGTAAVSFQEQVKPILDARCVVCHACWDAPCQLLLSSPDGIARGASKDVVYEGDRLLAMQPTRLGIDAHGAAAWRQRGFFAVAPDRSSSPSSDASLLELMLELGRAHRFPAGAKLPDGFPLDIDRTLSCARPDEFPAYVAQHPQGGMPYGMAPLADAEVAVLATWLGQGAPLPAAPAPVPAAALAQVAAWEEFLNGGSLKQRITARYLYEHWFIAHLYFPDLPRGPFFRVVRSATPPGEPVREIATVRPYDAPGVERFWYRLIPIDATIVRKTHIVYALGPERMRRLQMLFLDSAWEPTRLPSYDTEQASNPFVTFDQIPPRARYQYMLDDAQYFIMTFIRGPVCRGQVAVDVIEDHFFVAFLDPDHDPSVLDPTFLERAKLDLSLPAEHLSRLAPGEFFLQYGHQQKRYLELREQEYDALDPQRLGPTLDFVWDGDGKNTNAQLTVFRHFDNASVERGFVGAMPKTAWIIDYPLFERIYYDLVAGYDVFGAVTHQVATRLYMDHLRMQGENLFLTFLPADQRETLRASWYVGATSSLDYARYDRLRGLSHGTRVKYLPGDPMAQLIGQLIERNPVVAGPPDLLNRCAKPPCDRPGASALERRAERALQQLAGVRGPWVALMPEIAFLRVRDGSGNDAAYSLVHDRAHANVAFMFDETARLVPADDTMTIARGYLGDYPNFVFSVDVVEIESFVRTVAGVREEIDFTALVENFGVRRTSPEMWATVDWLHADDRRREPTQAGLFDLARYQNH